MIDYMKDDCAVLKENKFVVSNIGQDDSAPRSKGDKFVVTITGKDNAARSTLDRSN